MKRTMPAERHGLVHRFAVADLRGYIRVGHYEDGTLGEIFISASKQGSFTRGLLSCLSIMISVALQRGVSLEDIVAKLKHVHFEPYGVTHNREIPMADSVVDYVARWLELKYCSGKS